MAASVQQASPLLVHGSLLGAAAPNTLVKGWCYLRNRSHRVEVYFNDEEFSDLLKRVKKSGLCREEYMRQSAQNVPMKEMPPLEFHEILKNLRQINNNMNQIAMKANATGFIDAKVYRENNSQLQEQIGVIIRGLY